MFFFRDPSLQQESRVRRAQRHALLPLPGRQQGGPKGHVGGGPHSAGGDLRDFRLVHRGKNPDAGAWIVAPVHLRMMRVCWWEIGVVERGRAFAYTQREPLFFFGFGSLAGPPLVADRDGFMA